jgi:DNA-binding transcriptional regulator YhcF (GntR family)
MELAIVAAGDGGAAATPPGMTSYGISGALLYYISQYTSVIPFRVDFRPGVSLHEQVVYAAKKAMISGQIRPGDPFPSVRFLSEELKINPNTAHKVGRHLMAARLLEAQPGIGTVVAKLPEARKIERTQLARTRN